jgi:5-formyltetrahydrofolate cyclo-ligase
MPEDLGTLQARKRAFRAELKNRLASLSGARIQAASRAVDELLASTEWWREAAWVFAYIAMPGEVETREIITRAYKERKKVAIPRIEGQELTFYAYDGRTRDLLPNQFGVLEPDPVWVPVPPEQLEGRRLLILAPGLGFDRSRQRLGRGKGFYDRFLERVRSAGVSVRVIGLAFAEQLVEAVPVGGQDQPLDGVVTDRELVR